MTMTLPSAHTSLPEGVEMPLTPDEVANKTFPSVLRGYAKWEVDEFLKDVALDYQRALGLAEWAMQRSSLLVTDTAAATPAVAHDDEETIPAVAVENTSLVSALPPPPPPAGPLESTTQSKVQMEKLGEHIRYLAVLVNNLNQRIDLLETQRPQEIVAQAPQRQVHAELERLAALANGVYPAGFEAAGSLASDPAPVDTVEQTRLSPSEWWPSESPLWVVNKANGSAPTPHNHPRG
jgi:DivIVA domain-containing protein